MVEAIVRFLIIYINYDSFCIMNDFIRILVMQFPSLVIVVLFDILLLCISDPFVSVWNCNTGILFVLVTRKKSFALPVIWS